MSELAQVWGSAVLPWFLEGTALTLLVLLAARCLRRSPDLRAALVAVATAKWLIPPLLLSSTGLGFRLTVGFDHGASTSGPPPPAAGLLAVCALFHLGGMAVAGLGLGWRWRILRGIRRRATRADCGSAVAALEAATERLGLRRRPDLLVSDEVGTPFAMGLWRPAVVVPSKMMKALPLSTLEPLIAHEAAHLRQRDVHFAWAAALVRVLWWFHPLARRLAVAGEEAREERCDDRVIAGGLARPDRYCRALVDAAVLAHRQPQRLPLAGALGSEGSGLEQRVHRMLGGGRRRGRLGFAGAALALLAALVALPPVLGFGPAPGPAEEAVSLDRAEPRQAARHRHDH